MSGSTRAHVVADQVRADILSGVYLSGEWLREMVLAGRLGVSQTTVRDALALLEHEGWVVKQPRHGVTVRAFTPGEVADVYDLIGLLTPLAFERAVEPGRKPYLRTLTVPLDAARQAMSDGQAAKALYALLDWHIGLAQLADRPVTGELLTGLIRRAQLIEAVREARAPLPYTALSALVARLADVQRALGMGDLELAARLYAPLIETVRTAAVDALTLP